MDHNDLALVALNLLPQVGAVSIHRLLNDYPDVATVFEQSERTLRTHHYLSNAAIQRLLQMDWQQQAKQEVDLAATHQVRLLTCKQSNYPANLRKIDYPPPVIYIKGELTNNDETAIAVVGTRRPTDYGRAVTKSITADLAKAGITIVSGLAYGIDSIAHQTALQQRGRTIAVVAHGMDQVYPRAHRALLDEISCAGVVVSEFPFHYPALAHNFPRRNRIISGMAKAVLVIEAPLRSGSLITARWAAEQGRDVFVVPGSYFSSQSEGCHALINEGAKVVCGINDIIDELFPKQATQPSKRDVMNDFSHFDHDLQAILKMLQGGSKHIDQLGAACQQALPQLYVNLLTLEMKGVIIAQPGQHYQLNLSGLITM